MVPKGRLVPNISSSRGDRLDDNGSDSNDYFGYNHISKGNENDLAPILLLTKRRVAALAHKKNNKKDSGRTKRRTGNQVKLEERACQLIGIIVELGE